MSDDWDHSPAPVFEAEWLTRYRSLSLASHRFGGRSLLRQPSGVLPAGGTEVTGVRDYSPGDDLRTIDWKLCARRDEVLTKTFEGRVDRPMTVLLDVSGSMAEWPVSGGHRKVRPGAKFRLAQRIAAVAGCTALDSLTIFRLFPFSGGLCPGLPALRGRWHALRLLRFLAELAPHDSPTDLGNAVAAFMRQPGRRGPVLVVSDLLDGQGFSRGLDLLRHHGYEPRVVHLYAAEDAHPPRLGDVALTDRETGERQRTVITERAAARYRQLFERFLEEVADYCRSHAVPWLQLSTDTADEEAIRLLLGLPAARRGVPEA